jgi:uncharacterized membrane protein YqaE (UPF0057 family)
MSSEGTNDFWRVLLAYFVSPVAVFLQVGLTLQFWVNLVLYFVFPWIGGVLHGVYVISTIGPGGREEPDGMQTFVSLILAFFLPPVGVLMKKGVGMPLVINIILSLVLPWVGGLVHAAYVITSED